LDRLITPAGHRDVAGGGDAGGQTRRRGLVQDVERHPDRPSLHTGADPGAAGQDREHPVVRRVGAGEVGIDRQVAQIMLSSTTGSNS